MLHGVGSGDPDQAPGTSGDGAGEAQVFHCSTNMQGEYKGKQRILESQLAYIFKQFSPRGMCSGSFALLVKLFLRYVLGKAHL